MSNFGQFQDPYCRKEFWRSQLERKAPRELERGLAAFEEFLREMEAEFRVAMSSGRREACRETLEALVQENLRQARNVNQGELFD